MALSNRSIINGVVTREQTTATETWLCDWSEVITQALAFVGGYQGTPPVWVPPASFTELPGLKAEKCTFVPFGNVSDPDTGTYKTAMLTVDYGVLKPSEENNDPNQIYETEISFGGEGLQIPGSANYKWNSGPNSGQALPPDVYATKIIPSMEITCKYRYRPTLPVTTINSCQGQINSSSMSIGGQTFSAGTVLFNGCGSTPGQSTDGTNGWSRELKFLVRPDGWNYLWDPKSAAFQTLTPNLYQSTNLMSLFSS